MFSTNMGYSNYEDLARGALFAKVFPDAVESTQYDIYGRELASMLNKSFDKNSKLNCSKLKISRKITQIN